ncbi:hypothetical protein HIM_11281 [Hirsutella minnesotensis 3608]|uniref:Uncharacterized protein n=1 Tax=Hirsutella minnesotensis 3608 TaxID=1043627 RepID=A0A0F7ZRB5_9HYPO|nr:hypothetical protein HIM_11281 [Hirsutella minnesotensis 3608]
MASTTVFPMSAEESLFEDGFFYARDAALGEDISEMQRRGFPYYSNYGLDFCQQYVLNERIRTIVETFFGDQTCTLAHWLRYRAYPGHIVCFRSGGPKAGRRRLLVHLLAKGTRVGYWSYSHKHALPTLEGKRLLHELAERDLVQAGCTCNVEDFPDGGIAILDGRVAFEIVSGYAITFEFATVDVLDKWTKMILPKTPGLAERVAGMQSSKIRINFEFEDPVQGSTT